MQAAGQVNVLGCSPCVDKKSTALSCRTDLEAGEKRLCRLTGVHGIMELNETGLNQYSPALLSHRMGCNGWMGICRFYHYAAVWS